MGLQANTIEEKIIELQEKKQTVFDCTVGNSNQVGTSGHTRLAPSHQMEVES